MIEQNEMTLTRSLFVKSSTAKLQTKYKIIKQVGKGAYGSVFLATLNENPAKRRAIKEIQKKSIKQPLTFINEIEILKKLDHPNIIKIYETFEDDKSYFVVTDYCEGGELFEKLSSKGNFSQSDALEIFKQMLYAVNYCHTQKIAHRDLKPENFLFLNEDSNSIKLIDFGLSFEWKQNMNKELKQRKMNKMIGTAYYIAPEVIKGDYSEKCDIWSLGVILFILVTATPPFDGATEKQIFESIKKGQYSLNTPEMKACSAELKNLISRMLQPEKTRIQIEEIYKHPWLNGQVSKGHLRLNFGKMQKFSQFSKVRFWVIELKKFAVTCIASQLSGKEIQKLGKLFKQIDSNNDGYITTKELKSALDKQKQRATIEEIEKMMKFVDTDHNGKLNYTQFIACCLENSVVFKQENLITVFRALDSDGNGMISREELKKGLTENTSSLSPEVIQQIVESSDVNGDGMIDFKQFLTNMSQLT